MFLSLKGLLSLSTEVNALWQHRFCPTLLWLNTEGDACGSLTSQLFCFGLFVCWLVCLFEEMPGIQLWVLRVPQFMDPLYDPLIGPFHLHCSHIWAWVTMLQQDFSNLLGLLERVAFQHKLKTIQECDPSWVYVT